MKDLNKKELAVLQAAKKWAKQRARTFKAEHLGKARSRTALYERAEELHEAVNNLEGK